MFGTNIEIVRLNSKKYGKTIGFYNSDIDRLGNGYIVRAIKRGKMLSGYINSKNELIIDLEEMSFNNYFTTNLGKDMCLGFISSTGIDRYFHIRSTNNNMKLVMETDPNDPLIVSRLKGANDYWALSTVDDSKKVALYDYNLGIVTTSYLNHLEVINDDSKHRFYYEKDVEGIYEGENVIFTTLCGFMDGECNFSSDILDAESENQVYDGNTYKNTLTKDFQSLTLMLITQYLQQYKDKETINSLLIEGLYNSPIDLYEIPDAKILEFNRKKV